VTAAAKDLKRRVADWSVRLRVSPKLVRVYPMRRKWGSCSSAGIITLAIDLADRDQDFRDFVIAHELLHLRYPHHSRLFKAIMTMHIPNWRKLDARR
jgi:predicted metal-dependent hydrolase